jgi:hypothetical protein
METTMATKAPASQATDHHMELVSVMASSLQQKPCPYTKHRARKPIENEFPQEVSLD